MDCQKEYNLEDCACTYPGCPRKGICCECLQHHLQARELPACCFPPEVEKTYDRSMATFAELYRQGKL
ncbi:MAG TPA: cytosolic protein [Thermoplasmatales archaeon]|nr:cytosolic protein [Thermoplasmatales archaeon]